MVLQRGKNNNSCLTMLIVHLLHEGILIMGLALFPIIALWLNTESLLLLAQQAPCVARLANGSYS